MESQLDARIRELEETIESLNRREAIHTMELEALQRIATSQLATVAGVNVLYEQILDTAVEILHADLASLQMFYPERGTSGELRLLSHRGFSPQAAQRWKWVTPLTRTTCGEALRTGQRIVVPDVETCEFIAGSEDLEGYLDAGIRAALTSRLVSRSGALTGMVSVYWREPHALSASEARVLDILARVAADAIERSRADDQLREALDQLQLITANMAAGVTRCSRDVRYLWVSRSYAAWLGLPPEEIAGRPLLEVIGKEGYEGIRPHVERVLSGEREEFEAQVNYLASGLRWIHAVYVPTRDKAQNVDGWIAVVTDVTDRHEAEQALQKRQQQLMLALSTGLGIWECDLQVGAVSLSPQFQRVFGSSPLSYGEWMKLIHPDDVDRVVTIAREGVQRTHQWEAEFRLLWPDGTVRWMISKAKVILDNDGRPARMVGVSLDVTERKRDEAALKESEERLRASEVQLKEAQRLAKVGSWERHIEADRIYWSEESSRILGVPSDAPSSFADFLKTVHPKDREKILETDRKLGSINAPVEVEFRIMRTDGEVRFVRSIVKAIRNDRGDMVRLAGATQDITEQAEGRELLRGSEERLKNAERLAHLGHWNWDLKSNKAFCSEECCRIFGQPLGYTPSYEDFLNTIASQDRERVDLVIRGALSRKSGYTIEFQVARPTGEVRLVRTVAEILLDEEGMPAALSGTCHDITDVMRAQQESFARQKLESVGTLARGIAHDFNNLLGGILASTELALTECREGSLPEEELLTIRTAAIRGGEIVRQLMTYGGEEGSAFEPIDLSLLVTEMLQLLKVSISKHATLETELKEGLPAMRGNPAQIRQLVMNLVTNASEAIGERTAVIRVTTAKVRVDADRRKTGAVKLAPGDYLKLEVSDTGRGMTPEVQTRIFDPFFTTKSAGHGLGLATVQGIVLGHLGTISVVSSLGKGTSFEVLLPCTNQQVPLISDTRARASAGEGPGFGGIVMVVEDEDTLRTAVSKMLRKKGLSVIEAIDGSSALDCFRANEANIAVVLLDITLPRMSGPEVFAELQRIRPDIAVIVTSAYGPESLPIVGRQPWAFIQKPYHLTDLWNLIIVACRQKGLSAHAASDLSTS